MTNVTKFEHARFLKRVGMPLTTGVEERTFSREYSKRWFAMLKANVRMVESAIEYSEGDCSQRSWRKTARAIDKFIVAANRFVRHGTRADEGECAVIAALWVRRLQPVLARLDNIATAFADGEEIAMDARSLLVVDEVG